MPTVGKSFFKYLMYLLSEGVLPKSLPQVFYSRDKGERIHKWHKFLEVEKRGVNDTVKNFIYNVLGFNVSQHLQELQLGGLTQGRVYFEIKRSFSRAILDYMRANILSFEDLLDEYFSALRKANSRLTGMSRLLFIRVCVSKGILPEDIQDPVLTRFHTRYRGLPDFIGNSWSRAYGFYRRAFMDFSETL